VRSRSTRSQARDAYSASRSSCVRCRASRHIECRGIGVQNRCSSNSDSYTLPTRSSRVFVIHRPADLAFNRERQRADAFQQGVIGQFRVVEVWRARSERESCQRRQAQVGIAVAQQDEQQAQAAIEIGVRAAAQRFSMRRRRWRNIVMYTDPKVWGNLRSRTSSSRGLRPQRGRSAIDQAQQLAIVILRGQFAGFELALSSRWPAAPKSLDQRADGLLHAVAQSVQRARALLGRLFRPAFQPTFARRGAATDALLRHGSDGR